MWGGGSLFEQECHGGHLPIAGGVVQGRVVVVVLHIHVGALLQQHLQERRGEENTIRGMTQMAATSGRPLRTQSALTDPYRSRYHPHPVPREGGGCRRVSAHHPKLP